MRSPRTKQLFLEHIGLPMECVYPEQIHGEGIAIITNQKNVISGVDGLIVGDRHDVAVSVRTADCVPILAIDPSTHTIGVAHAGWRGTKKRIAKNLIESMEKEGADINSILVSIGPHIGACCYSVPEERAWGFLEYAQVALKKKDTWYLDNGLANYLQLVNVGVKPEHIDVSTLCTSCKNDEFFSYRKDTKETFGEMVSVIGFTTV
jgi:hypothetical protein